jgi:Fur family ferric uptake transcriptional regulator
MVVNPVLDITAGLVYPEAMDHGRNRRNREALLDAARSIDHAFSARELHQAAKKLQPALGLSTAYRALERWREDDLIEDAGTRDSEAVYLMCAIGEHHHHLVCASCGSVSTLDGCALASVRKAAEAVGFELNDQALASLPGRCAQCAAA